MRKIIIVLLTLDSVLVFTKTKDNQPAATSYITREDGQVGGKGYGYGFSKKYGYNKMIVTTFLAPVPEEVAASYSTYVVHPDEPSNRYNQKENSLEVNPIVVEDPADVQPDFLKLFPIVVAEGEENEELEEKPKNQYKQNNFDTYNIGEEDKNVHKRWFFGEEPKDENGIDDDTKEFYRWWYEDDPKTTTTVGYYKRFKNEFDSFYEGEFKQFFGDDDDFKFNEEDDDKKDKEKKEWFTTIPYMHGHGSDASGDKDDKWRYNYVYEPKHFENYGWWHKWI